MRNIRQSSIFSAFSVIHLGWNEAGPQQDSSIIHRRNGKAKNGRAYQIEIGTMSSGSGIF